VAGVRAAVRPVDRRTYPGVRLDEPDVAFDAVGADVALVRTQRLGGPTVVRPPRHRRRSLTGPPAHRPTACEAAAVDPELRGLVDQWIEEVASDIEQGLAEAGRFDPATRHMRGVLAFAQLDHAARSWARGRDRAELDRMIDVLTDSRWGRLGA
jgi:hypothetical protein